MIKISKLKQLSGLLALSWCMSSQFAMAQQQTAQQLYRTLSAEVTPELSARGENNVGVRTVELNDPAYVDPITQQQVGRKLTVELWYPAKEAKQPDAVYENVTRSGIPFAIQANALRDAAPKTDDGKYPLVVLSHGYTGYRTIMYYLGEHLASHGYIVAGIDHTDSTNAEVDIKNAPFAGFLSTLLNRSRDQHMVLDKVAELAFLKGSLQADKAGLIGYSMGGFGAVNTVGGCYQFSTDMVARFTAQSDAQKVAYLQQALNSCAGGKSSPAEVDSRWAAAIAFAPWGGQLQLFDQAALGQIKVPLMYASGDLDDVSGYQGVRWLYEHSGQQDVFMLTYHQARHNIAPHPAPQEAWATELDLGHYYEPVWDNQALNTNNSHFALAMMDCYVKKHSKVCEYLSPRGESDQQSTDGSQIAPWIGFDNRFAAGMQLEGK